MSIGILPNVKSFTIESGCKARDKCLFPHHELMSNQTKSQKKSDHSQKRRENVRVARVLVVYWARTLHRPPTASPVELGTGVLWVSTGTHPCGPSPRQGGEGTRAPALHTLDDVLRFRGDEEKRAVLLHPSSTCSCPRSGRLWEHVHT